MKEQWYVLTGGPGSGKTTTINALAAAGYTVVPEVARRIFEQHLARGESVEAVVGSGSALQHEILAEQARVEADMPKDAHIFFDRAMPDQIGYYTFLNIPEDDELRRYLADAAYRKVFFLDLVNVEEDEVRKESAAQAAALHEYTRQGYEREGYEIVRVPVMPVADRVEFILANL